MSKDHNKRETAELAHIEERVDLFGNRQQAPKRLSIPRTADLIGRLIATGSGSLPSPQILARMLHGPLVPPPVRSQGLPSSSISSASDIGRLVREERQRRKLSQQAFADLAGVGRRFLSELENGKTTLEIDKVLQVAAIAGLELFVRRT